MGRGMTGLGGMSGLGGMNQRGMMGQYGNQRGTNRMGNLGGMGGYGAMGGMRRNINLQTQMTIDFPHPVLEGVQVRNTIERRVNATSRIQKRGPLQIEVVDRTATLRGVVATEDDRALAVRMARLEPGISEVRDELTVGPSEPAPPTPQDR